MIEISIIIPVYNEAESLPELCTRLDKVCKNFESYEVIYVDDGSTDGSFQILEQITRNSRTNKLIKFSKNAGKSDALDAGFRVGTGKFFVTLDSDLQNPPEEIIRLIDKLKSTQADAVVGWRHRRRGIHKKIISLLGNTIRQIILSDKYRDSACGLKVFKRECIESITMYKGMHRFLPTLFENHGFKVEQMKISDGKRKYGKSKFELLRRGVPGFFDTLAVFWLRKRRLTYKIDSFRNFKAEKSKFSEKNYLPK